MPIFSYRTPIESLSLLHKKLLGFLLSSFYFRWVRVGVATLFVLPMQIHLRLERAWEWYLRTTKRSALLGATITISDIMRCQGLPIFITEA